MLYEAAAGEDSNIFLYVLMTYYRFWDETSIFLCVSDPVIPMYFFLHEDSLEFEKQEPGSQIRLPSGEGSGVKGMFLWNQAMFVIAQLLTAGLLHINELDPIRRYLPSYSRPRTAGRYSAFQVDIIIFSGIPCMHNSPLFLFHTQT
jgi:hypothetical protein